MRDGEGKWRREREGGWERRVGRTFTAAEASPGGFKSAAMFADVDGAVGESICVSGMNVLGGKVGDGDISRLGQRTV